MEPLKGQCIAYHIIGLFRIHLFMKTNADQAFLKKLEGCAVLKPCSLPHYEIYFQIKLFKNTSNMVNAS